MSEIKKPVAQEVNDDELDVVAGGAYTTEEWNSMTEQQRVAAKRNSAMLIAQKKEAECKLVN